MSTIPDNPVDATKPETQPLIPTTADQRTAHTNINSAFAAAKTDVEALESGKADLTDLNNHKQGGGTEHPQFTTAGVAGFAPGSSGGTTDFLRADGQWAAPPGQGGGEANTSSNSGAGEGLALPKAGVDLPFKSITAGANITLTPSATELQITATGGGSSVFEVVGPPAAGGDTAPNAEANRLAIQAAIDAVDTAGGGTVQLSAGTYWINDAAVVTTACINIKNKVRLIGTGMGGTILKISSTETRAVSVIKNLAASVAFVEISHITVDGNRSRVPSTQWGVLEHEGIDLANSSDCWIHHCHVVDCGSDGIDVDTPNRVHITDNRVDNCGGCAIHGNGEYVLIANNITTGNSYYRLQDGAALSVKQAAGGISFDGNNVTVVNNISRNDEKGIVHRSGNSCVFANNLIFEPGAGSNITGATEEDPSTLDYDNAGGTSNGVPPTGKGQGIYLLSVTRTLVADNVVVMRTGSERAWPLCIAGNPSVRNSVTGNQLTAGLYAAYLNGCGQTLFSGNQLNSAANYNMHVSANVAAIQVVGNSSFAGSAGGLRTINSAQDVTFQGNVVQGASGDGINVIGPCQNIVIENNTLVGNADAGIEFQDFGGPPVDCVAKRNVLNNTAPSGEIKDAGTGTIIADNVGYVSPLDPINPSTSVTTTTGYPFTPTGVGAATLSPDPAENFAYHSTFTGPLTVSLTSFTVDGMCQIQIPPSVGAVSLSGTNGDTVDPGSGNRMLSLARNNGVFYHQWNPSG